MKADSLAVLGLQWGDEGKGKIIDYLSEGCDAVARFGGGANAGHTIVVKGERFILRLLPSGILHPGKACFIGSGVACDPEVLQNEITELEKRGISTGGRVFVDFATHLVLPLHKSRDNFEEASRGNGALDTTRRGIGPSYADRVSRIGVRVVDLFDRKTLEPRISNLLLIHKPHLDEAKVREEEAVLLETLFAFEPLFRGLVADVGFRIMEMISAGRRVLFEGAQGSLLDIDFGTYPYTTSSHTTVGGILTGLGIAPAYVGAVVGVVKSYATRVGHGPFPTELKDELGQRLRGKGAEFGSVTGRPRRTGWLDLVALKRTIKLNGVDKLAVTKLDVLDGLSELNVCEAYDIEKRHLAFTPPNHPDFSSAMPVYTRLDGWSRPAEGARKLEDLPSEARAYLDFIQSRTGVPVWLVSTGSSREDTIIIDS